MFVELMPLLKQRTLLITVARVDERLKVNVIPVKAKEGEDEALTTPLSYTGSPEELDRELGQHLASYVDSHLALGSTLAEAKAEMDAAAKTARQKAKTAQQTSKPDTGTKKEESAIPVVAPADTTPSLFPAQTQSGKSGTETSAPECTISEFVEICVTVLEIILSEHAAPASGWPTIRQQLPW